MDTADLYEFWIVSMDVQAGIFGCSGYVHSSMDTADLYEFWIVSMDVQASRSWFSQYILLLLTTHGITKTPEADTAAHNPPSFQSIQNLTVYPSNEVPISYKSFLGTSCHPNWRWIRSRLEFHMSYSFCYLKVSSLKYP